MRPVKECIPESTIQAVHETRKKGNLCYLCTGRSLAEIYPYILDVGFDGIIGAGGGFVQMGDEMLYHKKVSDEDVHRVVDFFETNHYDYYLESNGGLFASKNLIKRLESIIYGDLENDPEARRKKKEEPSHFITALIENENMYRNDVNKICFLEHETIPFDEIRKQFSDAFQVIECTVPAFGDASGELSVAGVNKHTAIEALINHLGIDQKDTYAYGDGMNDAEMLTFVAHGVAVGNAKEGLKAIADEVCDDIANDGIYKNMKEHGLI